MLTLEKRVVGKSRRPGHYAFTLVELLVVIGIISLLISLLMPALAKAKQTALAVRCAANLRAIALGVTVYITDNQAKLPPCQIRSRPSGSPAGSAYPQGWFWATEMLRQNYISAPSCYATSGGTFSLNFPSVFFCPSAVSEVGSPGGAGDYPTDPLNNGWALPNNSNARTEGIGVASWYMLASRVCTTTAIMPGGTRATPFLYYSQSTTSSPSLDDAMVYPGWSRNMSQISRGSEVVMIGEASDTGWIDGTQSTSAPSIYLRRMAARHGETTADGLNAFTNLAFFDGHVALYPTLPFSKVSVSGSGNAMQDLKSETIFYLNNQ